MRAGYDSGYWERAANRLGTGGSHSAVPVLCAAQRRIDHRGEHTAHLQRSPNGGGYSGRGLVRLRIAQFGPKILVAPAPYPDEVDKYEVLLH